MPSSPVTPRPLGSMHDLARALMMRERVHEAVANNIANASTAGYKADRFTMALLDGQSSPETMEAFNFQQGNLHETGGALDVALEGQGFLVVSTPTGEELTRGGNLMRSADGLLVDAGGNMVLGENGPIAITGTEVTISKDGTISVDGKTAGKLRVVTAPKGSLHKTTAGRFKAAGAVTPDKDTMVRQGAVEESNVDAVSAMVDMITNQRAFDFTHSALRTLDEVTGQITSTVGRIR